MHWHHLYINIYFVFWHLNHRVNAFFTPTWVWEVIPNPMAVFPFVDFVGPYENTAIAKAIRLRPYWERFQNTFQNIPQSCVWCGSVIGLLSNYNTEGVHNGLSTLWFIGNLLTPVNLAGKTVGSMGSIKASVRVIISYGSFRILQRNKPTPNYLSHHADHSKNNVGIEISWHSSPSTVHAQIASSHIFQNDQLLPPVSLLFTLSFRSQNIAGAASS